MAKRKSGALKSAKFPPPSPFRESENIDNANVAFGDLEFEASIQDYVKDSPVALLALQDINKRGGISKFIKALQKGDKYYGTTSRGTFNPKTDEINYNVTDVLDFLETKPTKEQVEAANLVQSSIPTIAHELFHYGVNVLRKKGYDVPQGYIGRERGDPRISTDVENEEAIIDFLEKYQRKRTGEDEDDFEKSARLIGLPLKRGDRSEQLLGSFRSSGYSANESPFSLFQKGMYKRQESSSEALDRFEDMALDELKERNYARTREPKEDTRDKSFLEKLAGLNPFREKPRPMYKEGGVVNMLRKMK